MAAGRSCAATRRANLPDWIPHDLFPGANAPSLYGVRRAPKDLGYCVGENVATEYRFADGKMEWQSALAVDLVQLGVDIIIASGGNPATVAAMKATTTIPIVLPFVGYFSDVARCLL